LYPEKLPLGPSPPVFFAMHKSFMDRKNASSSSAINNPKQSTLPHSIARRTPLN
jgi:hypothetical protein